MFLKIFHELNVRKIFKLSCKHRQAIKAMQCEKKLFKSNYILLQLEKYVEKHAISIHQNIENLEN